MSIVGPGILFRYRAGGSAPGVSFSRGDATTCATRMDHSGVLTTVAANVLRTTWEDTNTDGVADVPGLLIEPSRVNRCLWARDLSNGAWTKTNTSATKNQVGIDGVASSASSLTATAGNGTCLQGVTIASATWSSSAWLKRLVGTGNIQLTVDNGATWTTVNIPTNTAGVPGIWTRIKIPAQTLANPTVGFRIVTSGDSIAVDYCQLEAGPFITSSIATTSAAVTRAADNLSYGFLYHPQSLTIYAKYVNHCIFDGAIFSRVFHIGNAAETGARLQTYINASNGHIIGQLDATGTTLSNTGVVASVGDVVETRMTMTAAGVVQQGVTINGGAETLGAASAGNVLPPSWGGTNIWPQNINGTAVSGNALLYLLVLSGVHSMDGCRALV